MASRKRATILAFVFGAGALVYLGGAVVFAASTTFILAAAVGVAVYILARRM